MAIKVMLLDRRRRLHLNQPPLTPGSTLKNIRSDEDAIMLKFPLQQRGNLIRCDRRRDRAQQNPFPPRLHDSQSCPPS
jgi:hypothetical protein